MNNSINDFIKGSKINSNINKIEILVKKKAKSKKIKKVKIIIILTRKKYLIRLKFHLIKIQLLMKMEKNFLC
jgi:hypothetical protein